ncbi:MAG TPA: response regulator [Candidatus Sulfotelmatobacter sp.]|nr:response regulator [Candidatus Sulfotelmatobacter sp.]HWI56925.1 response regulator [Bacillota bacterium]
MNSPGSNRIQHKRILLADDQNEVRHSIRLLLSLDQHTVTEADNGREAWEQFHQDHFDLVITDYKMPEMQGNELATKIKQLSPTQPILLITADRGELSPANTPVDAILDKPFTFGDLRQAIATLLA